MLQNYLEDFVEFLTGKHGEELWVTVYKREPINNTDHDGGMYCSLVEKEKTMDAMQRPGWDLMVGSGGPGFCTSFQDGEEVTTYYTSSDTEFLRPVLVRNFYGKKEDYIEILEEFRLFHNLYHCSKNGSYLSFDEAGDEVEVIKVESNEVKIRRRYLRSFMAARQMNLLLYFEHTRHYKHSVDFKEDVKNESLTYTIYSGDSYSTGYTSFSRILGKKLIRCEPVEKCGVWPFEKEKEYQNFIIGGDIDEPETFYCDPDKLANYFGANPDAPHYLTPVFFRKEVMQKYYSSSDYEITDGHLYRKGAWSLRFDNNSPNHVSVFLGDLGKDLPSKEQIYWKSFNIIPDGRRISRANFERSFLGNFYDSENPEYRFKQKFEDIQKYWNEKYGWHLFLPLHNKDEHFYSSIRSMLNNEQSEFDSQVLALAKVTIDSINVRPLRDHLEITDKSVKSISLMEALLERLKSPNLSVFSSLLRGIQSVRSSGVAHRKGTEYEKAMSKLEIDEASYTYEFDQLLLGMLFLFEEIMQLDSKEENDQVTR